MTIDIDFTKYSAADLIDLNRRLVVYMRDKFQAATYHELAKYNVGERVSFVDNLGELVFGIVIRVNKKTVSIHTDDHRHWNVSPHLLKKGGGTEMAQRTDHRLELFEARQSGDLL